MTRSSLWTAVAAALACACSRPIDHAPPAQTQPENLPPASLETEPRVATPVVSPTELSATIAVRLYPVRATRASDVRVASFVVTLSGMTSDVDGALDLITPQGALYEHRPTAIGTALPTTQLDFPVAGTLIDQNQLTGHWTADFLVSGQPFASASFQLDP